MKLSHLQGAQGGACQLQYSKAYSQPPLLLPLQLLLLWRNLWDSCRLQELRVVRACWLRPTDHLSWQKCHYLTFPCLTRLHSVMVTRYEDACQGSALAAPDSQRLPIGFEMSDPGQAEVVPADFARSHLDHHRVLLQMLLQMLLPLQPLPQPRSVLE